MDGIPFCGSLNKGLASREHLQSFAEEETKNSENKNNGIRKMWLAAFASLLLCFTKGLAKGYSAPATYDMRHRSDSMIKPTEKEVMWIGSILALGIVLGSLISGPMADRLGRKDTLIYNLIPQGFGWLITCYAETIPILLIGRFINGIAIGVIACVVPVYCVEISTVEVRGILGSACQGFIVIGNLISVTIGACIAWNYLALNGAVCSIIAVVIFCPFPESPRWLLMKNKFQEAVKVMNNLQGGFVNAEEECRIIYQDLQNKPKGAVTWKELMQPSSYKPTVLCLFVMFFHEFSGINAVMFYSTSIFDVSKDFINPKTATIILGVVQVIATLLSNAIVDKVGRKILLTLSGCLMGLSFAVFGFYYYKLSLDKAFEDNHGWIPLTCCVTAVIVYSIGYGPIPFLLAAELIPIRVRSTLNSVIHVANAMFGFTMTNTFSDLNHTLKNYGTFWFYSCLSVLGVIFILVFLPETKGKTTDEIQNIFDKNRSEMKENII